MGLGASVDAASYLGRASRSDPDDAGLRERAFTSNLLSGRVDEAAAFAPPPAAGDAGALAGLGRLTVGVSELAQGRGKAALQALAQDQVGSPHGQAASALAPWAELLAGVSPTPAEAVSKPGDLTAEGGLALNRARLFERLGRRDRAETGYRNASERSGGADVLALGGFLERQGRRDEARKVYAAAQAKAPGDTGLALALARLSAGGPPPAELTPLEAAGEALIAPAEGFAARHQPEVGLIYLRLALRLNPRLAGAWLALGDGLQSGGDPDDAIFAWRQVRPDQPEHAQADGRLAMALQQAGDKPGALALAADAAKTAPADTGVQLIYAELLRDDGRYDEAAAVADRLVRALPSDAKGAGAARLYFLRGSLLERAGRWPQAQGDLQRAVALQPDDAETLNYLGFAWADRGERLPEALAMLQRAAALQPEDGAIADSVGWARYRSGDVKGAVRDLERAVQLAPADADVNDHLGDAYARTGRRIEAAYQWRRVLTLDPDAKLRTSVEAKLRGAAAATAT